MFRVPFDRDTQLYNVISIAAALPSKIVEAFLDLCYGRIVNRTGQLDEADLNLLIRSLGRIGCPSLREDLVDLGTGFGDSLLRALFYVAETENDPILAGRVLEKLTSRLPPNRRSWRRSVASVCDNRASQWRLSLIQWLFDNTKHIESPVHDDDPGAAKSAQLSKRWVDFLHFLNAYFRESLDDHPRIDTEAQTATSSRQPSGGERSRPSSVLSEIPPNKVPRYR